MTMKNIFTKGFNLNTFIFTYIQLTYISNTFEFNYVHIYYYAYKKNPGIMKALSVVQKVV